ncbi:hypothetical protein GCM10010245_88680 [Streptomyces spectabilis]|uniref:Uncharacterized protein n=1 Tax=Streptomyces spectabilis TaxID=68270 RepID=A0A7W8B3V5_STRST|nr:hypothetical protein [Streptomyces spectabilis]GGV55895.1 hypothetical protein GCM10010245_88680 [Streptomyces spectabilis]
MPPPWPAAFEDHTPGHCLTFWIRGHLHGELKPVEPGEYLRSLKNHWAELGVTGYPPIDWPRSDGSGEARSGCS